jgi:hypothetical protein
MKQGHERTKRISVRLSEADYGRLVERAKRARARTPSAYVRAACLTGQEFELPSWDELRELRNAVINANHARDLPALVAALDRISRF